MPSTHTLSICIPNYNMGRWVSGAIRSALMQPVSEVVVVDNASTDDSVAVLAEFNDRRLAVHLRDDHVPMYENISRAVSLTTSEWCLVLCADDELTASFYSQFTRALEQYSSAVLISQSVIDPEVPMIIGDRSSVVYGQAMAVLGSPMLPLSTSAFRRDSFESVGGFDTAAGWPADRDLWVRLVLHCGPAIAVGAVGGLYYRSRGTWVPQAENSLRELGEVTKWLEYRRDVWPEELIREMERSLAERHERVGRVLLSRGDSAGWDLLRVAAGAGRKSASRRLLLERRPRLARTYDSVHHRAVQARRRLADVVR